MSNITQIQKWQFCFSVKIKIWVSQDFKKEISADQLISAGIMAWYFNSQISLSQIYRSFPFFAILIPQSHDFLILVFCHVTQNLLKWNFFCRFYTGLIGYPII